jgi:nucleotidyltransferase/DNA polymerase involved in DNA repair
MKNNNQTPSKVQQKKPTKPKDSQALQLEELERWRGESPAAGQVTEAKQLAQKTSEEEISHTLEAEMADESSRDLPARRNSAGQTTPDVTAENWSAEKLAQESIYQDETQVRAQMKAGKKTRSANAS